MTTLKSKHEERIGSRPSTRRPAPSKRGSHVPFLLPYAHACTRTRARARLAFCGRGKRRSPLHWFVWQQKAVRLSQAVGRAKPVANAARRGAVAAGLPPHT